jgi:hypothetical protein
MINSISKSEARLMMMGGSGDCGEKQNIMEGGVFKEIRN